jgi:cytochrome c oxidase cbb3-type subunit 2
LVAAVYIYFLIFSQFGFLHRVAAGVGDDSQNLVLGVMGLAGIVGALVAGFGYRPEKARVMLVLGFLGSALSAAMAAVGSSIYWYLVAAAVSGVSLGALTVVVVGLLDDFCSRQWIGFLCGLGTGIAYFFSNVPIVFEGSPMAHCWIGVVVALVGLGLSLGISSPGPKSAAEDAKPRAASGRILVRMILIFLILIWMDSAAFSQIQETPELKQASWSGAGHLWMIGGIHFIAAVVAGILVDRGRFRWVVGFAFLCLAGGYGLLVQQEWGVVPSLAYAAGVSFYSTALVVFALSERMGFRATVVAGVVYSLSGWVGSAMGIGMAQNLGRVPVVSWIFAAALLAPVLLVRIRREALP